MQLQAHISGQLPNQAGSQLPGLAQTNDNALPTQIPNLGGIPDAEFNGARKHMQEKIYDMLLQRLQHPVAEHNKLKYKDFAKRLEESLLKSAPSKEEHLLEHGKH
ncbi:hypothetical protein QN277_022763 [Acacia crassicarpa]|uniref:Uncharacterized protein n=1 Tax=Acacia crassicarpa TaxID=499986 RepID=A0AAE1MJ19_9FABA|nr:hypothetical protein QN277_022763 [Acacia crassicarpa]